MIHYITHIKDVLGNNYLGINIQKEVVDPFLVDLKEILGEDNYEKFTDYQQKRDSGKWHITVINTMDYNRLSKKMGIDKFVSSLDSVFKYEIDDLKMLGIGTAERNGNRAYFIVCRSEKLDALRKRYGLSEHDFHVTLGFFSKDVFGVPKNEIIKKEDKFLKLLRQEFNKEDSWGFVKRISNFDLNPKSELIPISISNTSMKFKCDGYYLDIGWLDDDQKFWIMSKYPVEEELPRLPETEISKIINK
jgi:hypothetical protein